MNHLLWKKFDSGEGLSLDEMAVLIKQAEEALAYLTDRSAALGPIHGLYIILKNEATQSLERLQKLRNDLENP